MSFIIPSEPVESIEQGTWVDYEGSKLKIAYAASPNFMRIRQKLEQPHRRKIESGTMDPVEHKTLITRAMSKGLLLDWKGVLDAKGQPAPFSQELAYQAMSYDEDLREFVMEVAVNLQNFKSQSLKEDIKS